MPKMTSQMFTTLAGRNPEHDDLERVNCVDAGKIMHSLCGWCRTCMKPIFECRDYVYHRDRKAHVFPGRES